MRLNILIGGKAGQGINKISQIVSTILAKQGYYTFNYRDYQSAIRGGHNFNILSVSDEQISSHESQIDGIIAMDELTIELHKPALKNEGFIISPDKFEELGMNLNIAQAGALIKILGISNDSLIGEIKCEFEDNKEAVTAAEKGYASESAKFNLKQIKAHSLIIMTGSDGVAQGAINSKIDIYFSYPMTPSTAVLHTLAAKQIKHNYLVFQPENEIAVVNSALGASFSGAKTMVGSSGGGYDLMAEGLSFQGMSELPLVVYLASRPGPGTGIPTYTLQGDLDIALRAGHGEFPRVVIAPGSAKECIEKTNEAFFLSQKFGLLVTILSDKHLAESEFSFSPSANKVLDVKLTRKLPGKEVVKASSYEHDSLGLTTESAELAKENAEKRLKKYEEIKKECKKFEMIKIHGKKNSKNLIIGWGSTKGAILDATQDLDFKFLQVLYLKPLSNQIKEEMQKAKNIILIENNLTGQLGRLIREKTGISIKHRILKYDYRPFLSDELKKELMKIPIR